MGGNIGMMVTLIFGMAIALNILKIVGFFSELMRGNDYRPRDPDSYIAFDERVADKLRDLEREQYRASQQNQAPAPPPAPTGFGRRVD